jgi:hypothetical protein
MRGRTIPGWFDDALYSECKFLDIMKGLVLWEYRFDVDGGGQDKAGRRCWRQDIPRHQAEAGGGGAPMAIIVVPSVGTHLLAAVRALRRHLRTRPTGHSPTLSRSAGAHVRQRRGISGCGGGMDVNVSPRGDQGDELGAGGGAPVNAG